MKKAEVLEALELLASDQWGIITTAQAEREGITRLQLGRLAEQGVLQRARRGVYLLPSSRYGPFVDICSAWVALDPGLYPDERRESTSLIVVSHESAASLHYIGDLIPQKHSFSAVRRKQTSQDDIRIYSNRNLPPEDVVSIDGLPVTSVERTVADLAAKKIERNYLATLAADALKKEGVRFRALASYLDPYAAFYRSTSGEELLHEFQTEASSVEDRKDLYDRISNEWAKG